MFTECFQSSPLTPLLAATDHLANRGLVPPASDRKRWEGLSPEKQKAIRALRDQYAGHSYPMRTATGFLAFTRSGSRKADENPYFFRRRKLCAAILACALAPEDTPDSEAALNEVIDGIWCICEETSWVISAHNVNPIPGAPTAKEAPLPDPDRPYIDLFSAQTAMILSFVLGILEERLNRVSSMLSVRIRRELKKRVLDPFMETNDFWWMGVRRTDLNNWTPWILSNLMVTACLFPLSAAELRPFLERAGLMLDRYLACLPEDGGCDEGAGYWNMAGGALLDCLELLETVTGGVVSFWEDEKIRNILCFPRKVCLKNGWFVNFADCDARPFLSGERLQTAGEKLQDPELLSLGWEHLGTLEDQLNDVPHLTRVISLLFHAGRKWDPNGSEESHPENESPLPGIHGCPEKDVFLPDLQLRVLEKGEWILCCKGGHNGENHNHNDVGSFMLYRDGEPQVVDAGNMTYTALTFSEKRYTLWNTRSAFHNLPLIGGTEAAEPKPEIVGIGQAAGRNFRIEGIEQAPGRDHAARDVRRTPDGLSLEIAKAWPPEARLLSCLRSFSLKESGLILRDVIRLEEPRPVVWVFLWREKPVLRSGEALSGKTCLRFDPDLIAETEEIPVSDPRMARSFPGSLWRLTLTAIPAIVHDRTFSFGEV